MKKIFTLFTLLTLLQTTYAQRFNWATSGGYVGIANSLNGAIDIAKDPQGNVYTMDFGNGRMQCQGDTIDPLSSYTTFIYKFNAQGVLQHISRIGALSGDFYGYNLETDDAGSVYVVGQPNGVTSIIVNDDTVSATGNTNQLVKLDSDGNFVWKINTGAATNGNGCMLQYSNGYIYYQSGNLKVSKIDTAGVIGASLTASFYSSPTASTGLTYKGSDVFSNGDLLLAAVSYGRVAFGTDTLNNIGNPFLTIPILLVRCDTNMNVVWARYASNVRDPDQNFIPVAIDASDAVYVGVQVNYEMVIGNDTIGAQGSIFTGEGGIIKIDADGNDVWARALKSSSTCYAWCLENTSDNSGIMLGGGYTGVPTIGPFTFPIAPNGLPFIAKVDANGTFTKAFSYLDAPSQTDALCLQASGDGVYYVGGKLANATAPVFSCTPIAPAKGFYLGAFTEQPDTVPTPSITVNGAVLTATPPFEGNIEWFFNGNLLTGQTGQTITATQDGDYSVAYSYTTGCADTANSTVQAVVVSSIASNTPSEFIRVYPNPSKGVFQIAAAQKGLTSITVRNILGTTVYAATANGSNQTVDISSVAEGIYFIEVLHQNKTSVFKVLKQ